LPLALQEFNPDTPLPTTRTLQLWMEQEGLARPPLRRPQLPQAERRASQEHQVWQMDAAEHIRLASGQQASWLRVVDEYSGAVLATVLFPPRELARSAGTSRPGGAAHGPGALGTSPTASGR
jgi:hypothetical protein